MPARETVAGVAVFRFEISNSKRISGVNAIRSLLAKVSTWKLKVFYDHNSFTILFYFTG